MARHTTPLDRPVVLYDGRCPFCQRQVQRLLTLARRGAVEAVSLHDPTVPSRFPGLSADALQRAMHLVTPSGRVYVGFEAAVQAVATRRGVGWLAYLYYIPGIRQLLDRLYRWVAARRFRLGRGTDDDSSGDCRDESCAVHARGDGAANGSDRPPGR